MNRKGKGSGAERRVQDRWVRRYDICTFLACKLGTSSMHFGAKIEFYPLALGTGNYKGKQGVNARRKKEGKQRVMWDRAEGTQGEGRRRTGAREGGLVERTHQTSYLLLWPINRPATQQNSATLFQCCGVALPTVGSERKKKEGTTRLVSRQSVKRVSGEMSKGWGRRKALKNVPGKCVTWSTVGGSNLLNLSRSG